MNDTALADAGPIIAALLLFGALLKHGIPSFPNRLIPLVTALGGTVAFVVKSGDFTAAGLLNGFLVSVLATGTHSTLKNVLAGSASDKGDDGSVTIKRGHIPLMAAIAALAVAGCAGTPKDPQAKAFLALADAWATAKATMIVYTDAVADGKVNPERQATIDHAYVKFRLGFLAALELAQFNYSAPTPESVAALSAELLALIDQLNL
jgi:hypothetical protein